MLRDYKEKLLLLPVIFVVGGGIKFVWPSSFGFAERRLLALFGYSFPPCIVVFHLL